MLRALTIDIAVDEANGKSLPQLGFASELLAMDAMQIDVCHRMLSQLRNPLQYHPITLTCREFGPVL